ncbi:hypothetical protein JCM16358_05120 [Halanaerocella petrolearia]
MMKRLLLVSCLIVLLVSLVSGLSFASIFDWKSYETDEFILFYPASYQRHAEEVLYYLKKNKSNVMDLTGNQRDFKTTVILQNTGLTSNGYAQPLRTKISLFTTSPPSNSILSSYQSWLRLISIHEFTHISQLTNYSGAAADSADLFGNLFSPNLHSPMWVIEGITVYNESQISQYEGRLNDGYYDAILATKAQNGNLPSLLEASYFHNHYPSGQWYLYGGAFFRYLASTYGEEKLSDYFTIYGSYDWAPFLGNMFPAMGMDQAAKKIYGKDFPELFTEWKKDEELEHQGWQIAGQEVTTTDRVDIKDVTSSNNRIYYFQTKARAVGPFSYPPLKSIVEYNPTTGQKENLLEITSQLVGSLQIQNGKLYYAVLDTKQGFANIRQQGYGTTASIYCYDLETGQQKKILRTGLRDFIVLDSRKIIYIKDSNKDFGSGLWQYQLGEDKKLGQVKQLISEVELVDDKLVVVSKKKLGSWNLNSLQLEDMSVTSLVNTPYVEKLISVTGNQIYFTANYNQQYAIYCYNLVTGELAKVSTGDYAASGVVNKDQLYFVGVSSTGEKLYRTELSKKSYSKPEPEEVNPAIDLAEVKEIKGQSAVGKNLSYIFKPHTRLVPNLLQGEDALGLNSYVVSYSAFGDLDFNFTSQMLVPLEVSVTSRQREDKRENILALSYPLYKSLDSGLSSVETSYKTDFDRSIPGIKFGFNYPNQRFAVNLESDIINNGYNSQVTYQYLLDNGSLRFQGSRFNNFDQTRDLRGYELTTYEQATGYQVGADYVHKLLEVREGFWNPNLFVGDVYGDLFIEHSSIEEERTVYGYEVSGEVGTAFYLHLVPKLGISFTEDEPRGYFKIDFAM